VRPDTTVDAVRVLMASAHTRYPVLSERDELVGVVHLADVLGTVANDQRPVSTIMREPLVVPTLMRLTDALENLLQTRNELACVIDEYGGFAGVVTIEDLAEELVGEIADEHDPHDVAGAEMDAHGAWVIDGDVHIDEVERVTGRDVPRGDYETIAGLVIATAGRFPEVGEVILVELPVVGSDVVEEVQLARTLVIEVVEIERHVPRTVRVTMREEPIEVPADANTAVTADDEVGR
jgi:CBS domain containing-hemolysin-like protein